MSGVGRPPEPPAIAAYRQQFYETYVTAHQGVLDPSRRAPTLERDVIARLPKSKSVRILDVGCGQGDLIALIRRHGWTDVSGIDLSKEQVETARRLDVTDVTQENVYDHASAHPSSYDVVLAMDFVEHFDRTEALGLFRALRGMLAPRGYLIMQMPNGSSPFSGRIFWSDVTHGMQYTDRSLAQICSAAGFADVRSFPSRPAIHGVVSGVRAGIWRVIESLLWLATAAETSRTRGLVLTQNLVAVARTSD